MAQGRFSKYNQAVLADDQRQQIKKAKGRVDESEKTLQQQRSQLDKELQKATLQDKQISTESVLSAKQQFQQREKQISQQKKSISQAEQKLQRAKSEVPSIQELENRGLKKEVKGNKIIFYREDSYEEFENHSETYRPEEYIFNRKTKKPVEFVERDEFRVSDRERDADVSRKVTFDNQGVVRRVQRFGEKDGDMVDELEERYDPKGRLTKRKEYDDGELEERVDFDYQNGKVSKKKRDYDARRRREQQAKDVENTFKVTDNETGRVFERTLYEDGSFDDELVKRQVYQVRLDTNQKTGVRTEQYLGKQGDLIRTVKKTPQFEQTSPQQQREITPLVLEGEQGQKTAQQIIRDVTVSGDRNNAITQTSTPSQIRQQRGQQADIIQNRDIVFGFSQPSQGQVNLNPARAVVSPATFVFNTGRYAVDAFQTGGQNVVSDVRDARQFVGEKGAIGTAGAVAGGTIGSAARDPFGFLGEGAAFGATSRAASSASRAVRRSKTTVDPIDSKTETIDLESSPNRQGVGVEVSRTNARFQVNTPRTTGQKIGDFLKSESSGPGTGRPRKVNREVVEADATTTLDKETRAFGQRDPDVSVEQGTTAVSRESVATDILEGRQEVNVRGPRTQGSATQTVSGVRQGRFQVVDVGNERTFSRTDKIGTINNENVFRTQSVNPRTGEASVGTSMNVNRQRGVQQPTSERFADGSVSETDLFFNVRDRRSSPADDSVEVGATSSGAAAQLESQPQKSFNVVNLGETPSTQRGATSSGAAAQLESQPQKGLNVVNLGETPSAQRKSSEFGSSSAPSRASRGGSGQVQAFADDFAEQQQTMKELSSRQSRSLDRVDDAFERNPQAPTQTPISSQTIRNIAVPRPGNRFVPSFSLSQSRATTQTTQQFQGLRQPQTSFEDIRQGNAPAQSFESSIISSQATTTRQQKGFSFNAQSSAQTTAQTSTFSNPSPGRPSSGTPVKPPVSPPGKPRFRFDLQGSGSSGEQPFSFGTLQDDGRYVSSLGGALTGKTSRSPTRDITGLKLRAVQIGGKRNK